MIIVPILVDSAAGTVSSVVCTIVLHANSIADNLIMVYTIYRKLLYLVFCGEKNSGVICLCVCFFVCLKKTPIQ